jgi:ABC-2 type transport system ATP-binding protein
MSRSRRPSTSTSRWPPTCTTSPLCSAFRTSAPHGRSRRSVGLADRGADLVGRLSGGEQARISLACALLADPELIVLDEPTVGLDPVLRRDLWRLFHELADAGATLLVSSHVMDEAERCDRLLLLREGRLVADDTPGGLRQRTGTGNLEDAFLRLVERQDVIA